MNSLFNAFLKQVAKEHNIVQKPTFINGYRIKIIKSGYIEILDNIHETTIAPKTIIQDIPGEEIKIQIDIIYSWLWEEAKKRMDIYELCSKYGKQEILKLIKGSEIDNV